MTNGLGTASYHYDPLSKSERWVASPYRLILSDRMSDTVTILTPVEQRLRFWLRRCNYLCQQH